MGAGVRRAAARRSSASTRSPASVGDVAAGAPARGRARRRRCRARPRSRRGRDAAGRARAAAERGRRPADGARAGDRRDDDRGGRRHVRLGDVQLRARVAGCCARRPRRPTRLTGEVIPSDVPGPLAMAVRQPAGVVVGMAPWNAPVILGTRAVATPLAFGNTVVLKASEQCPRTHAGDRPRARRRRAARPAPSTSSPTAPRTRPRSSTS